jgi:hypothetical protein
MMLTIIHRTHEAIQVVIKILDGVHTNPTILVKVMTVSFFPNNS